ncbi:MAG: hypothetical protein Ct9H300mP28_00190 [Pseudomonadota bacterium]|nr:MAG: hypothetical protein Ct9H300mP28_00190 [Pseudomonadota bacterium]
MTTQTLGGHSLHSIAEVANCKNENLNGLPEYQAIQKLIDELAEFPNLEVLVNSNVFGLYEDNLIAAQCGPDLFKIRADSVYSRLVLQTDIWFLKIMIVREL